MAVEATKTNLKRLAEQQAQEAEERANSIINALESAGLYSLPAVRILEHNVAQFGKIEPPPFEHPELPLW